MRYLLMLFMVVCMAGQGGIAGEPEADACPGGSPAEMTITVAGVDGSTAIFTELHPSYAAALRRRAAIHVNGLDLPESYNSTPFYPAHRILYVVIVRIC